MAEKYAINVPYRDRLPSQEKALLRIREDLRCPQKILEGLTPLDLFENSNILENVWLVGSRAWRPIVLGDGCPEDRDFDIVFCESSQLHIFIGSALHELRKLNRAYDLENNKLGGLKIAKAGIGVIDAWCLPENTNIAEHIMGFGRSHERVAVEIASTMRMRISGITRLVCPEEPQVISSTTTSYGS